MSKKPLGRTPRRVDLQNNDKDLTQPWGLWLEQVRQNLYDIRDLSVSVDPSAVGSHTTNEESFTASDIATDDAILSVNKPSETTGFFVANARAGDEQVHLTFANNTGSSINAGAETYIITVLKR